MYGRDRRDASARQDCQESLNAGQNQPVIDGTSEAPPSRPAAAAAAAAAHPEQHRVLSDA